MPNLKFTYWLTLGMFFMGTVGSLRVAADPGPVPLTMVVMDPLAAPLSCPCVKGYAQRDYQKLATFLGKELAGRPMRVFFDESLGQALKTKTAGRADLIIGKASVVRAQARTQQLKVSAVASLTGKDGLTTQTGLFVVAGKDPALTVADLKGYHLFLGPSDSEEKHGAALGLLKELGVAVDRQPEVCPACSDGANKVLDHHRQGEKGVAVISSYALALLEGCGNVKKGDLRLVGATAPVPFVVAFVNDRLPRPEREAISQALLRVGKVPDLCRALESQKGFVPLEIGKSLIQQDRR